MESVTSRCVSGKGAAQRGCCSSSLTLTEFAGGRPGRRLPQEEVRISPPLVRQGGSAQGKGFPWSWPWASRQAGLAPSLARLDMTVHPLAQAQSSGLNLPSNGLEATPLSTIHGSPARLGASTGGPWHAGPMALEGDSVKRRHPSNSTRPLELSLSGNSSNSEPTFLHQVQQSPPCQPAGRDRDRVTDHKAAVLVFKFQG